MIGSSIDIVGIIESCLPSCLCVERCSRHCHNFLEVPLRSLPWSGKPREMTIAPKGDPTCSHPSSDGGSPTLDYTTIVSKVEGGFLGFGNRDHTSFFML